jgi:hypothetical protein
MHTMQLQALVEINPVTNEVIRELWRAKVFAAKFPNLVSSYGALRGQIQRRKVNGMETAGAIVATRIGYLVDVGKYQTWLLQPCERSKAA